MMSTWRAGLGVMVARFGAGEQSAETRVPHGRYVKGGGCGEPQRSGGSGRLSRRLRNIPMRAN